MKTPQSPAPVAGDEWTPWTGGPRPHPPATCVRVRYRDGTEDEGQSAFARWWHDGAEPERDIIAFRLSRPASEPPVEGGGAGREEMVERLARYLSPTDFENRRRSSRNQHAANKAKTHYRKLAKSVLRFPPIKAALSPASPARPEDVVERISRERNRKAAYDRAGFPASFARTPMGDGEIGEEYDVAAHCVTLAECPPGLFFYNGTIGFKSEYGAMESAGDGGKAWRVGNRPDAYCADSGEFFWGGTSTHEDRAKVLVMPIDARTVAMVASHGPKALAAPTPMGGEVEALREAEEKPDLDDMRQRAKYLRGYADIVSKNMYRGERPSGIWNLERAAHLLDQAAQALAASSPSPAQGGEGGR